jgi:flagellin-like protein
MCNIYFVFISVKYCNFRILGIGEIKMKNILKSRKGISPILATLLLIVIAVAAVIVTYAWVMTFTGSSQAGAVLTPENVRFYNTSSTDYVEITLRNSGTADATVASVYVGTSDSNLALQSIVSYDPGSQIIARRSSLNITITYNWTDDTSYHFNIITEEGLTCLFQREA